MLKFTSLLMILIFFAGCASIHSGNYAKSTDASVPEAKNSKESVTKLGLVISGKENKDLSSQHFGTVNLTFENKSPKWIHIKKVSIEFPESELNEKVRIPVGYELDAWAKATQERNSIRDFNSALIWGSIMAAGGVAAGVSSNRNVQAAGAVSAIGAGTVLTAKSIDSAYSRVQLSKILPATHLLSEGFVIPPGLHAMKWITFYTEAPNDIPLVKDLYITYNTEDGRTEKVLLNIRDERSISEWQKKHPVIVNRKERTPGTLGE